MPSTSIPADDDEIIRQMTGVEPARPPLATGANRLARIDPARYKRPERLTELQSRHRLMIEYLVWGISSPVVARIVGVATDVSLDFYTAADAARVRRREARRLVNDALFRTALADEIRNYRKSRAIRAIRTIEDVMEDVADNTAADRKVRLQAATAMLGEDAKGPLVNVNVGGPTIGTAVVPGYILDLRPEPSGFPEPKDVTPFPEPNPAGQRRDAEDGRRVARHGH